MNFKNPTYIQIGGTGNYGGQTWRAVGRVVLGVVEDGDIYYWNEFNLESDTGKTATLVFERTERGSEWRWFTQFEPEYAITAADAATKEVGDLLNLDGTDVRVTLLETSRIYFVEGKAPSGEFVGCQASYFNAENGDEMLVVSWTRDQVECYRGRTITDREVRAAFRLDRIEHTHIPAGALTRYNRIEPAGFAWSSMVPKVLLGLLALYLLVLFCGVLFHPRTTSGITRLPAPPTPLKLGASGRLAEIPYRVTGHALLDVSEVNLRYDQQEYFLRDVQGNDALLITGFIPGDKNWFLFTALHPVPPMTPYDAAAMKLGQIVQVDKMFAPVDTLFTCSVRQSDFSDTPQVAVGDTFFGFAGKAGADYLLANWNVGKISFWKGRALSASTVLTALNSGSAK